MSNMLMQISAAMLRTGILGYGGGPSIVPLIRYEAVTRYGWMSDEEFSDGFAIANTLPGPIATKLAAYLGYRQKGFLGAIVGVLSHIAPTCVAMVVLYAFIDFFSNSSVVKGMIAAVVPVVAVMLGVMAYEFGEKAVRGLGWVLGVGLFAAAFVLLQLVSLHPAVVIAAFLLYGSIHHKVVSRRKERGGHE